MLPSLLKSACILVASTAPFWIAGVKETAADFSQAPLTSIARNDALGLLTPLRWSLDLNDGQNETLERLLSQEGPHLQVLTDEMNSAKLSALATRDHELSSVRRRRELARARAELDHANQALEQQLRAELDEVQLAKIERWEAMPDSRNSLGLIAVAVLSCTGN